MFVDALMASSSSTTHGSSSSSNGGEGSGNSLYEAPCKTDGVDTCEYSELTDERDAQIYKTVKIGNQVWMAENLNYKTENSYCYNDSTTYCDMYGRLYTWDVAMEICPSGWHLPDTTDWKILVETVGGWNEAGKILKSKTGWISFENGDNYLLISVSEYEQPVTEDIIKDLGEKTTINNNVTGYVEDLGLLSLFTYIQDGKVVVVTSNDKNVIMETFN
jgi:uncharacterized protein (TIGR02145 family)